MLSAAANITLLHYRTHTSCPTRYYTQDGVARRRIVAYAGDNAHTLAQLQTRFSTGMAAALGALDTAAIMLHTRTCSRLSACFATRFQRSLSWFGTPRTHCCRHHPLNLLPRTSTRRK